MSHRRSIVTALVLLMSISAAHAESRDSGVSRDIAAQGNHALRMIRAEAAAAFRLLQPSLAGVRVHRDPAPSPTVVNGRGVTFVATTAVRAAE